MCCFCKSGCFNTNSECHHDWIVWNFPFNPFCYRGIVTRNNLSYPYKLLVTFSISIRTTHLWTSSYSDYQQFLFDKIKGLKDDFLTPICYRKISKLLNGEGLKTTTFTPFIRKVRLEKNESIVRISLRFPNLLLKLLKHKYW